jgi:hypothetical protein
MSAFSMASTAVFASVGLMALALGLLARAYSGRVLAVGLAGLFGVTTASAWIAQAGPEVDVSEIKRLTREIAKLKEKTSDVTRNDPELIAKLDEARRQRDAAEIKAAQLQGTIFGVRLAQEAEQKKAADAEKLRIAAEAKLKDVQDEAARTELALKLGNQFYSVQPLKEPELVHGLTGKWYVIQLSVGGRRLTFPDRKPDWPEAAEDIRKSAATLHKDIIDPLTGKNIRLFVRGSADFRTAGGSDDVPSPKNLSVLTPRSPDGTYDGKTGVPLPRPANGHLPNLRADWLRNLVGDILAPGGSKTIQILDNPPEPGHDRTVELVLYVPN